MAQPLDSRISAAMSDGARAATVSDLIGEIDVEISASQDEHDRLDELSKSATATETEAERAADLAAKSSRKIIRLGAKKQQLAARLEVLLNSERRKRAESDHASAKANRDQLVADLAEHWPRLTGEIASLLDRIVASDAELTRVNASLYGREWLASAEAEARNCPGNFYLPGGSPVLRFVNIKLPGLSATGTDTAWPRAKPDVSALSAEAERRARLRMKQAAEDEANRWKRYVVSPPEQGSTMIHIGTQNGRKGIYRTAAIHRMSPEQVADAKSKGCEVRAAKANETIGAPSGVASF